MAEETWVIHAPGEERSPFGRGAEAGGRATGFEAAGPYPSPALVAPRGGALVEFRRAPEDVDSIFDGVDMLLSDVDGVIDDVENAVHCFGRIAAHARDDIALLFGAKFSTLSTATPQSSRSRAPLPVRPRATS